MPRRRSRELFPYSPPEQGRSRDALYDEFNEPQRKLRRCIVKVVIQTKQNARPAKIQPCFEIVGAALPEPRSKSDRDQLSTIKQTAPYVNKGGRSRKAGVSNLTDEYRVGARQHPTGNMEFKLC